jgi:hypothetical protein
MDLEGSCQHYFVKAFQNVSEVTENNSTDSADSKRRSPENGH